MRYIGKYFIYQILLKICDDGIVSGGGSSTPQVRVWDKIYRTWKTEK